MSDVEGPMSASDDEGSRSGSDRNNPSEIDVTEEEVVEYARYIGIDVQAEPHLRWIAEHGVCAPVPAPWKACEDGDEVFYHNAQTNESIWEHPCDEKYKRLVEKYRALGPAGAPPPGEEHSDVSASEDAGSIVGGSCSSSSRRSSPRSPRSSNAGGKAPDPSDVRGSSRSGSSRSHRSHRSSSPHSPRSHRSGSGSPTSLRSSREDDNKEPRTGSKGSQQAHRSPGAATGADLVEDESFASDASGLLASQSAENFPGHTLADTGNRSHSPDRGRRSPSAGSDIEAPPLKLTIVSARGLRDADWVPGAGKSDPYCVCEIAGKPKEAKVQTKVINDNLDPVWEHHAEIPGFRQGDTLVFKVWDKDLAKSDFLGELRLESAQFYPHGFDSELPLANAGRAIKAYLKLKIQPAMASSAVDEDKGTQFTDNIRRQVSSRSKSNSSRSASPEPRRSSSHGSRSSSPPLRSGGLGHATDALAPTAKEEIRPENSNQSGSNARLSEGRQEEYRQRAAGSCSESDDDIEEDIASEPPSDEDMNVEKEPPSVTSTLAPVGMSIEQAPSKTTGAPVAERGLDDRPCKTKATLKTWSQLQTEIRALSELLEGVRAVRVKQEEYLQRLISGPQAASTRGS